jgi:hypothetical protein
MHDEASNKRYAQEHDHCSKFKLPREKDSSPTHRANHTYGGVKKINWLCIGFFFLTLNLEKRGFANLYYKFF